MSHQQTDSNFALINAIHAFYNAPTYHYVAEAILIIWIIKLIFYSKNDTKSSKRLTPTQEQELIDEWKPEPLVPDVSEDTLNKPVNSRLVSGVPSTNINVNGKDCINLATFNFLNFIGNKSHEERAIKAIRKYGVGSCGPRGFYGTVDVHLNLEEELAKFLKVEEAILYSYGFATAASAIPAYSKRGDVIFADEQCHFAIQKGIDTSRSKVYYYEHNNTEALEKLLKEQAERDQRNKKKAAKTRKFIVTEGIFINTGEICDLEKIVEFKYKYKVRIFLDESISFGTIGRTGRGITEHLGIEISKIDMIMCSLEYCLGSNGGFCAGSSFVIDHQRLSGLGYCFSASLPPLLTVASSESLKIIDNNPEYISKLKQKSDLIQNCLSEGSRSKGGRYPLSELFVPCLNEHSPITHIYCEIDQQDRRQARIILDKLVEYCEQDGVAIVQAAYLWDSEVLQSRRPSIRLTSNIGMEDEKIIHACDIIKRNSIIIERELQTMEPIGEENEDTTSSPTSNGSIPRPNSLNLLSFNGSNRNESLLSSPVLGPPERSTRIRTYSGNQGARIIMTKNLSSDSDSDEELGIDIEDKKTI